MFEIKREKATKVMGTRLTPSEAQEVDKRRAKMNMSQSDFIRYCIAKTLQMEDKQIWE
mgnify:CR=1 FL=1